MRAVKNRFGSTNEVGVFEMGQSGLKIFYSSAYMLNGRPQGASGWSVVCSVEGTRPILLEIQALVCKTNFGLPRRTSAGTDYNRVNLLMAVLEKRLGLHLSECDAYVNITGGMKVTEPALDLAIVLAISSSFYDQVLPSHIVAFGEVGLTGEVRGVSMAQQRVNECKKLGFTTCILPKVSMDNLNHVEGISCIGVSNVKEAIQVS